MRQHILGFALAGALLVPSEALSQRGHFDLARVDAADVADAVRPASALMHEYLIGQPSIASAPEALEEPNPYFPYFARRQVDDCSTCHVAFPKLNTYGRLVKSLGYELPELDLSGLEESALKNATRYIPLALRTIIDGANGDPNDVSAQLDVRAIQLLGGGAIWGNRLSWWLHTHVVENDEWVNPFDNTPHELWGQYNVKFAGDRAHASLRAGMSELPLWFAPAKTRLSEVPYAIYDAVVGESSFTLSTPQYGVMAQGAGVDELGSELTYSWAAAAVNGEGTFDSNRFSQVFGRFTKNLSGTNVGFFGYAGSQDFAEAHDDHAEEEDHAEEAEYAEEEEHAEEGDGHMVSDRFYRVGFDVDANIGSLNVFALGLYGRDSNPGGDVDMGSRSYYGGFIGVDLSVSERLILSARYDGVRFGDAMVQDEHEEEEEHQEDEEAGHDDPMAGHPHGEQVTSNTDALVFSANYLLRWQLRLTTEFRKAFNGLEDKFIAGIQFAF